PDDEIDLAETALIFAYLDYPKVELDAYERHLEMLVDDVKKLVGKKESNLEARMNALREVMVEKHKYHGDSLTYEDIQNVNLLRVIDRRIGLPITLGLLYIYVARAAGWQTDGLNFPGHFLI